MTIRPPLPILIVDDSALARQALKSIVEINPSFRVLLASDPYDAVEVMKQTIPSAIVLDVNMPRMDGLTFLRKLMRQHPLPVILCTNHPQKGVEGLEYGALEVIPKPNWDDSAEMAVWGEGLRESLRLAILAARPSGTGTVTGSSDEIPRLATTPRHNADAVLPPLKLPIRGLPPDRDRITAIGVSTGGVQAITSLLSGFKSPTAGIVIVQHLGAEFTAAYADRLNSDRTISLDVVEARNGEPVRPGRVLIVPGGVHGVVRRVGSHYRLDLVEGPMVSRFRPSVDVLYRSVAVAAGDHGLGVILTGMLNDGAEGLGEMKDAGAWTIAQDEATSTVFGMNREAIRRGAACEVLPLHKIAAAVQARGN